MARKLRVCVKGYRRKGFTAHRGRTTYRVPATRVGGFCYNRRDIGRPGRGPKAIPPLREGLLTKAAREVGVRGSLGKMSKAQAIRLGTHLRRKYGQRRAFGMAHAQIVFRKRMPNGFARVMKIVRKATVGKKGAWD